MLSVIDIIKVEGRTEGWAEVETRGRSEGRVEGILRNIIDLIESGDLPRDRVLLRLDHLVDQGRFPAAMTAEANPR